MLPKKTWLKYVVLVAMYWLALCAPGSTSERGKAKLALDPPVAPLGRDPERVVNIVALQAGVGHYQGGNPGLDANFAMFAGLAKQAAASQPRPDLICFPEYAISGWSYPGEKVMNGLAEAIPGTGRWYRRYQELARETGVPILCWLVETSQGKLYNTAFIIDGQGEFKGKYRKVHTNLGEQVWWGWSQGEHFELIELDGVKYGVSICADMWFPETARCLELMGADAILHISIGSGDDDGRLIPARAYDSKMPIVATLFKGGSSAVNAKGRSLGQLISKNPAWKAFQIHPFRSHLGRKYGGVWDMKKGQQNLRNVGAYAIITDPAARPPWTEVFMDKKGGPQTREQLLQRFGGRYDAHDPAAAREKPQR
jgi:predicted amidohydrolase